MNNFIHRFIYVYIKYREREMGVGIESHIRCVKVPEKKLTITLIDTPGHFDFRRNMIAGLAMVRRYSIYPVPPIIHNQM